VKFNKADSALHTKIYDKIKGVKTPLFLIVERNGGEPSEEEKDSRPFGKLH
jgi:hypothetical protein